MSQFSLRVHEYVDPKDGSGQKMVRINPYVCLSYRGSFSVYIQGGVFYGAGGDPIDEDDLPDWFWEAAEKLNDRTKKEVGLKNGGLR